MPEYDTYSFSLCKDVKSDNILADRKGHVWIANYGLTVAGLYDDNIVTGIARTNGYIPITRPHLFSISECIHCPSNAYKMKTDSKFHGLL